ncbi:hypothetical protein [Ancylobacter terrae]|uniref:hypothetical protein n=1 Tax=Ancylobacter sp. sgz301288 TaxID=3342077 RepID=UPI00385D2A8D
MLNIAPPDDDRAEEKLNPAQERVLRKLRGFAMFSGLIMALGFLAVFGAIGYKMTAGSKSAPAMIDGTLTLPAGARVISAVPNGDLLAVTIERNGAVETRLFEAAGFKPRGVIRYASEP